MFLIKNAIVEQRGKKWVLLTKDRKRVLGTHKKPEDAYKQEYAIQKSIESKEMEKDASIMAGKSNKVDTLLKLVQGLGSAVVTSSAISNSPAPENDFKTPLQDNPSLAHLFAGGAAMSAGATANTFLGNRLNRKLQPQKDQLRSLADHLHNLKQPITGIGSDDIRRSIRNTEGEIGTLGSSIKKMHSIGSFKNVAGTIAGSLGLNYLLNKGIDMKYNSQNQMNKTASLQSLIKRSNEGPKKEGFSDKENLLNSAITGTVSGGTWLGLKNRDNKINNKNNSLTEMLHGFNSQFGNAKKDWDRITDIENDPKFGEIIKRPAFDAGKADARFVLNDAGKRLEAAEGTFAKEFKNPLGTGKRLGASLLAGGAASGLTALIQSYINKKSTPVKNIPITKQASHTKNAVGFANILAKGKGLGQAVKPALGQAKSFAQTGFTKVSPLAGKVSGIGKYALPAAAAYGAGSTIGYDKGNQTGYATGVGQGLQQGYGVAANQAQNTGFIGRLMGNYEFDPSAIQGLYSQMSQDPTVRNQFRDSLMSRMGVPFAN